MIEKWSFLIPLGLIIVTLIAIVVIIIALVYGRKKDKSKKGR